MKTIVLNFIQFVFILVLLVCLVDLQDKNKKLISKSKIKNTELVDQYLDMQIDNSKLLDHVNKLDDEIKILSSCCANGGLNVNDIEYGN